jgi:hypothetical protein
MKQKLVVVLDLLNTQLFTESWNLVKYIKLPDKKYPRNGCSDSCLLQEGQSKKLSSQSVAIKIQRATKDSTRLILLKKCRVVKVKARSWAA